MTLAPQTKSFATKHAPESVAHGQFAPQPPVSNPRETHDSHRRAGHLQTDTLLHFQIVFFFAGNDWNELV
jgi:hypothetical protein